MTLRVLDTDILTLFQSGHAIVVRRVRSCPAQQLAVSIVSVEEQIEVPRL
jgi:hypothetical protein